MDRKRGERVPESALNRTRTQSGLLHDQVSWKLVKREGNRLTFRMADLRINEFAARACERCLGWMNFSMQVEHWCIFMTVAIIISNRFSEIFNPLKSF